MSGIHRTKIEWADSTWNPITGCLHGCPHCYAAVMVKRFGPQHGEWPEEVNTCELTYRTDGAEYTCYEIEEPVKMYDAAGGNYIRTCPYPKGFIPTLHKYKLSHLADAKTPRRIFVGSMCDIFGEWVPMDWIEKVFGQCRAYTQHVYMFLTQNPERMLKFAQNDYLPKGDNFWYGSTITTADKQLFFSGDHNTFASVEPMLGEFVDLPKQWIPPDWIIVGPLNGPGAKAHRPKSEWIEKLGSECKEVGIPLFMKKELATVYGAGNLLKEYPEKMLKHIEVHAANYPAYRGKLLYVEFDGQHVKLSDLSTTTGIPYPALYERYKKGDVEAYIKKRLATGASPGKKYRERKSDE